MELKYPIDNIIRIDHSVRPSYPNWVNMVMHPELENTGPAEYDISEVEQWLHDGQKKGRWIEGNKIYDYFKDTDTLKTCLGLCDLEAIQKKGLIFFRKYFQNRSVFGWKGVAQNPFSRLFVPFLCVDGDKVVLNWHWLDRNLTGRGPALRLASNAKV